MWKSSTKHDRIGSSGGAKNGSARHQIKNGLIEQPEPDSIRQFWETAMDGVESSAWEDINEELWATARTSSSSSSSSPSSPTPSRQGGKLLQVFKRKVHLSSGNRNASQNDRTSLHDGKEDGHSRSSRTQDGDIISVRDGESPVDKLHEELETLRRKLEKKDKEMQKLKNEVSTLRTTTAIRGVQPQSQSQAESDPQEEKSRLVNQCDSFRSDASQLSCLDFSRAPSTGVLKFEGKIKTKITPPSKPHVENRDQPDSILSDSATLQKVTKVSALDEVWSTTKGSASSQMREPDIVDKYVEATKKSLEEFKAEVSEPEYAAMYSHDHTCGGLEYFPEIAKQELRISTQSYVYGPEEEFFNINAKASRSPPKSTSSTEEEDDFEFPIMCANSNSYVLHKAISSKVSDCVPSAAGPKSSCALSDVEFDGKSRLTKMAGGEEVDGNALTIPLSNETKDSISKNNSSPTKEDPLNVPMNSRVMFEVDKISKTITSPHKEDSSTSSRHPDLIPRSRSVLSPPRSRPAVAQVFPHGGLHVSRRSIDSQAKAGNSVEQPRTVEPSSNRNRRDLDLKILTISRSERSTEFMVGSDSIDLDSLPLSKSHRRIHSCDSTGPQSRQYTTTTAGSHEGLSPVLPFTSPRATTTTGRHERLSPLSQSTSPRATTTASRHEGLSPLSPSTSPRAATTAGRLEGLSPISPSASPGSRGLSPSRSSAGSQLLHEVLGCSAGRKPKSGSLEKIDLEEEVRQILEQSRRLLMSDDSGSEDEGRAPASVESFSVLAASRQRRRMEKNRHSPDMHQQHEDQAIILYGNDDAWNLQSRKVDDYPEVDAEQEYENYSISGHPKLSYTVEASHKKPVSQLVWEMEVQNSKNEILSSQPRRSRFFFEANTARISEVV